MLHTWRKEGVCFCFRKWILCQSNTGCRLKAVHTSSPRSPMENDPVLYNVHTALPIGPQSKYLHSHNTPKTQTICFCWDKMWIYFYRQHVWWTSGNLYVFPQCVFHERLQTCWCVFSGYGAWTRFSRFPEEQWPVLKTYTHWASNRLLS